MEHPTCTAYEQWAHAIFSDQPDGPPVNGTSTHGSIPNIDFTSNVFWRTLQPINIGFLNGTTWQQERVHELTPVWQTFANITFTPYDDKPYDILIDFTPGESWSYLGKQSHQYTRASPPRASMRLGCVNEETELWRVQAMILHQFGHALGLVHSHRNTPNGIDDTLAWSHQDVYTYFGGEPNSWDRERTAENVFTDCLGWEGRRDFDLQSIMLYSFPKEMFVGGAGTEENFELSDGDKEFMMTKYPGLDGTPLPGAVSTDEEDQEEQGAEEGLEATEIGEDEGDVEAMEIEEDVERGRQPTR